MYYKKFRKKVSNACKERQDYDIYEFGWNNALETSLRLFEKAEIEKKNIRIVSSVVNEKFFVNFKEIASKILNDGSSIEAIVLNPNFEIYSDSFADLLNEHRNGNILTAHIPESEDYDIRHPHYILAGDDMYRLELSHTKGKAVTNFNDPMIGQYLAELFQKLRIQFTSKKGQ